MKVLIVNTSDNVGGAAKAAYRLHKSLLSQNIESQMLVQTKSSDDFTVETELHKIRKNFDRLRPAIDSIPIRFYKRRTGTLFSSSWFGFNNIVKKINEQNPDIVHLHWICSGMLRPKDLKRIKAPIVWSLHDMWAFTGGCHYDEFCGGYKTDCTDCKVLGKNNCSLSRKILSKKKKIYPQVRNLYMIPTSRWIENELNKSIASIYALPIMYNPLDTMLFKKSSKQVLREYLNIPNYKKVILFGAIAASSDKRKGFSELIQAISFLKKKDIFCLIVGMSKPKNTSIKHFDAMYIPQLTDEISLPLIYNAADITIVPSLQETFGQMSSESLSCGTPVVGFDGTGTADIVDHKLNGYLAKPFDTADLANGIEWVLNTENYDELSQNARNKVLMEFDSKVVAKQYIQLYKNILKK